MLLRKLRCTHFKNHATTELAFADHLNFIVGPNGVGKTSLLDGIHYLALTKSAFGAVDTQNIQHGQRAFAVEGQFVKHNKPYTIRCTFREQTGKCLQNNDQPYTRLRDHIGHFPIVLTTPYDMDLIRGGSEHRRKFLNALLCQLDSSYLNTLLQYQQLLKQRNGLLRLYKVSGRLDRDLLASYEHRLLPLGNRLFGIRSEFIKTFVPILRRYYRYFVSASEDIQLVYISEVASPHFEQKFSDSLPQDLALQRTTMGVHRDEIHFLLNTHLLKKIGSQGQQKSFIIALRLAQFECMHQALALKPLLLLDDIFDKLDEQRIDRLMHLIGQQHFGQVFITDAKRQNGDIIMHRKLKEKQALISIG